MDDPALLAATVVLATLGVTLAGTLYAAMASGLRVRETLVPLLTGQTPSQSGTVHVNGKFTGNYSPSDVLNAGGSINLGQTTTPRTQDDIAARIVAAVRAQQGPLVSPTHLGGGAIQVAGEQSHSLTIRSAI